MNIKISRQRKELNSLPLFENIIGKGENAGNQHFLLFLQCFLPFPKHISIIQVTFILLSASALKLDQSKKLLLGKEIGE